MSITEQIMEKIRETLLDAVQRLDTDEICEDIAEGAIENEIGDIEQAAKEYIYSQASDWTGRFNVKDELHEMIDRELSI